MHELFDESDACVRERAVSRNVIHPSYSTVTLDYDFALLELASPVGYPFADSLQQATDDRFNTSLLTVAGWGATSSGGVGSSVPHHVQVPIVNQASCI